MSRYTELQQEYREHHDARSQRAVIEPFVVAFVEEFIRYLECPPEALKFIAKEKITSGDPRPWITMPNEYYWALAMRLLPDINDKSFARGVWEIYLSVRKKQDSFRTKISTGGAAGTGTKSWIIAADAQAAGIHEMCEWTYARLYEYYRDYAYFSR
jgi:hypothetical protein